MKCSYPGPCCGDLVFSDRPGSEKRCPICGWIDDVMQLRFPAFAAQPNHVSLVNAQRNYAAIGAKDAAALPEVRFADERDARDGEWRAIDSDVDDLPSVPTDFEALTVPADPTALYYWLPHDRA